MPSQILPDPKISGPSAYRALNTASSEREKLAASLHDFRVETRNIVATKGCDNVGFRFDQILAFVLHLKQSLAAYDPDSVTGRYLNRICLGPVFADSLLHGCPIPLSFDETDFSQIKTELLRVLSRAAATSNCPIYPEVGYSNRGEASLAFYIHGTKTRESFSKACSSLLDSDKRDFIVGYLASPLEKIANLPGLYPGYLQNAAIITRNRPEALAQCLGEFLENICVQFKHVPIRLSPDEAPVFTVHVFDDSDALHEDMNRAIIATLAAKYSGYRVALRHVDGDAKMCMKAELKRRVCATVKGKTAKEIETAVDLALQQSAGGNRNWVSLLLGTQAYLTMDDDVHPRVSIEDDGAYPVDVLRAMNRALGSGFRNAYYKYAIHRDMDEKSNITVRLMDRSPIANLAQLMTPRETYFNPHNRDKDVEVRGRNPFSVGGMLAVAGASFPPPTMTSLRIFMRAEDFILGAMIDAMSFGHTPDHVTLRHFGAIDHTKSPLGRPDISWAAIGYDMGQQVVDSLHQVALQVAMETAKFPDHSPAAFITTLAKNLRSVQFPLAEKKIATAVWITLTHLYTQLAKRNDLPERERVLASIRDVYASLFAGDIAAHLKAKDDLPLVQFFSGGSVGDDILAAGETSIGALLRDELAGFADVLEVWQGMVEAVARQ